MKMEKLEVSSQVSVPGDVVSRLQPEAAHEPRRGISSIFAGLLFLIIAIPYWGLRLLAELIWHDTRRVGRFIGMAGSTYLEASRRTR